MASSGWLCIDFTRTRGWAPRDRSDDELTDYEALVAWGERAGSLEGSGAALRRGARERPGAAERTLEAALRFRESLYHTLRAAGEDRAPEPVHLERVNELVRRAAGHRVLAPGEDRYTWAWSDEDADALDRVLWPVALSAVELLTGDTRTRLRVCDAHDCGWPFVDESRNRSRRWCDMRDCGNRAKVRRYRSRARES